MTTNYIDQLEKLCDIVSDWAVETVLEVARAISPTGRGLFQVDETDDGLLQDYYKLRGNPLAWGEFIMTATQAIEQKLVDSGLQPDDIASIHPFDIAQKYAISYSADMEERLDKFHSQESAPSGRTPALLAPPTVSAGQPLPVRPPTPPV